MPGTELGGSSPTNDATVTVSTTTDQWNAGTYTYGIVSGLNVSGTAPTLPTSFTGIAGSNEAHAGASGTFDITRTQGSYTVSVNAQGSGYRVGNEITVVGTSLGGATTANDALVVVSSVNGSGGLTGATVTGTGVAGGSLNLVSGVTLSDFTTATINSGVTVPFEALATIEVSWPYAHAVSYTHLTLPTILLV